MKIYSFLKSRALNLLPDSILQPLRLWHHRRTLRSFPEAEEPDLVVVRQLVEPGTLAVDLGANIGVFTKVLSELVGASGTVISVEPVPQTFEVLSRNVQFLDMTNVSCVNAAVSESSGKVVMELPDYVTGGTNFYQATVVDKAGKMSGDSSQRILVPAVTLDALVAGRGAVGFVKCDVEGHELACLAGAQAVLYSHSSAWLIEIWGDPDDTDTKARQTFSVFEDHSYAAWWFDGRCLVKRQRGQRSTNYFFFTEAHLATLRERAPQFFA